MRVSLCKQRLSDGSAVWSLFLWDREGDSYIELPAISEEDAVRLREKLKDSIQFHTNESVEFDGY